MAADESKADCQAKSLGVFLTVVGVAFSALLIRTLIAYPLFPIQPDDAEWSSMWLLTAVVDYYVAASCFCAVAVATEGPRMGTVWSLLTLILGAPFACAYTALHIYRTGSLRFRDFWYAAVDTPPSQEKRLPASTSTLLVVFYVVVGIAFATRLGWTLFTYPLVPLQTEDAEWASEWLLTTVFDIYTVVLCLLGMIFATEPCPSSLLWAVPYVTLGGPIGCVYLAQRLFRGRSVALQYGQTDSEAPRL